MPIKVLAPMAIMEEATGFEGWTYRWAAPREVPRHRLVLLNALVPPTKPTFMLVVPIQLYEAVEIAKAAVGRGTPIESYIGHESTAKALTAAFGVEVPMNRAMYEPMAGDVAIVARVRGRPKAELEVKPEDLEFLLVYYLPLL